MAVSGPRREESVRDKVATGCHGANTHGAMWRLAARDGAPAGRPVGSRSEVSGHLVGSAAFKAVGTGDPRPAGSIPVHLRQHAFGHGTVSLRARPSCHELVTGICRGARSSADRRAPGLPVVAQVPAGVFPVELGERVDVACVARSTRMISRARTRVRARTDRCMLGMTPESGCST